MENITGKMDIAVVLCSGKNTLAQYTYVHNE